jgi:hypothetical protein
MEALHQNLTEPKKKVSSIFDANHISKEKKKYWNSSVSNTVPRKLQTSFL